jgi:hypothetical protein
LYPKLHLLTPDAMAESGDIGLSHSGDADEVRPAVGEAAPDVDDSQDESTTSEEDG